MEENNLKAAVEALIFASEKPITLEQMRIVLGIPDNATINKIIEELKNEYEKAIKEAEIIVKKSFEENPDFINNVAIEYLLTGKFNVSKYVIQIRLENDKLI